MGGNRASKQTKKEEKTHQSNSEYELQPPKEKQENDQLQSPTNDRPVELSSLQQNNVNDNYNRMDHQHHHHHPHEQRRRIPLAINRWPKADEQKPKSFIEEYIHQ